MAGNWHRIGDIKGRDGIGVPTGGARGDVLKKEGGTDYATSWGAVDYADIQGKVPASALPEIGTAPYVVSSQAAMLNLPAVPGRQAIRTDIGATFVLAQEPASDLENWVEMVSRSDVTSVNDKTGSVVLTKADVGLSEVNNTADTDKPVATQSVRGLMSSDDKTKLDEATHSATSNAVARRDSQGRIAFSSVSLSDQPSQSAHAVPLGFLETELRNARYAGNLDNTDLNTVITPGMYGVNSQSGTSTALNFPLDNWGGTLLVMEWATETVTQMYQTRSRGNRLFIRSLGVRGGSWSSWVELASTELATRSSDGLMPRADKAKLDAAANGATANSLVQRNSAGRFNAATPTVAGQVANKGYVDSEITRISGGEHVSGEDFSSAPTRTRSVVVEGAPVGSPHADGGDYLGIAPGQVLKVDEELLGLNYATQKFTIVAADDFFEHMVGFAWERTWDPAKARWSRFTCVAGDTGHLTTSSRYAEVGRPWGLTGDYAYREGVWPLCRRIGPMVHLQAELTSSNSVITSADGGRILYFKAGKNGDESSPYETPRKFWIDEDGQSEVGHYYGWVQQGSSDNNWHIYFEHEPDGGSGTGDTERWAARASRYGPGDPSPNTWLPTNISWPAPTPRPLTAADVNGD